MDARHRETLSDPARTAALRRLGIRDGMAVEALDRLTALAARLLDAPVALVNLVGADAQYFTSAVGMGDVRTLPVEKGVCRYALVSREPLVIEDARIDPVFADNGIVVEHGLVGYIGVPLLSPGGHALGTFCVVDTKPRSWTAEELALVRDLAAMTTTVLDLRRAEQELVTERARRDAIFDQAPAFMATVRGPEHVFEMTNAQYDQVIGHREVLGRPVAEALPEIEAQGIIAVLDEVYRTGEPFVGNQLPMKLQREAGGPLEERILNLVYQPIREVDGTVSGILAHGVDVTEEARAQERLARAEAHYRRLVDNSPQTIYGQDPNGGFTNLNPAGERLLGTTEEAALGVHFREVVTPEDLHRAQDVFDRLMSGEAEQIEYELRVRRTDGEERLVVVTAAGLDEGDGIAGVQGVARDITAERSTEEQIRLLAAALQSLKEGVTIARRDGRMVYANAAHARLLAYDPERRPLPNVRDLVDDDEATMQIDDILDRVVREGSWTGRLRRRRRTDGVVIPMELIVGSIDRGEAERLFITISRDITGELERENHLRRTERLASLGTLVGGVAHELNNPLQAIGSFAELLLDETAEERVKEDLATIQREASRAAQIVRDLRMLARSTQDDPAERASIDLNDVVRHVLQTRRYALQTRNIEVVEELAATLPPVRADRGQLEQVLLNLVVNAEQAMEEGAAATPRLVVRTARTGTGVLLSVTDTGPGIDPTHVERIFDPFWTTKAPGEGTGLGLSLVHSLVSEHGGVVRVHTTPGSGTEFRVELPALAPVSTPAPSMAPEGDAPQRALRVLIVDDEASVRQVFARFLVRRGHRVDTAGEGGEALRLLGETANGEEGSYDVIVSDLRMPGLSGDALFRRLEAAGGGMDRKVVFMTGDAAGDRGSRVLRALDAPVLYKPMRLREAAEVVERHAGAAG